LNFLRTSTLQDDHGMFTHGAASTALTFDPLTLNMLLMRADMPCLPLDKLMLNLFRPEGTVSPVAHPLPMDLDIPGPHTFEIVASAALSQNTCHGVYRSLMHPRSRSKARRPYVHPSPALRPRKASHVPRSLNICQSRPDWRPHHASRARPSSRAGERRTLLVAKLERAQIKLWEAITENGTLMHLLKAEHSSSSASL
jgi:hypothetical protein